MKYFNPHKLSSITNSVISPSRAAAAPDPNLIRRECGALAQKSTDRGQKNVTCCKDMTVQFGFVGSILSL